MLKELHKGEKVSFSFSNDIAASLWRHQGRLFLFRSVAGMAIGKKPAFKYGGQIGKNKYSRLRNATTDCSVPAHLVYSTLYNDQKVRYAVYSAQYLVLKRKLVKL